MRRSTLFTLLLFLLVLGAAYYFNNRAKTAEAEATPQPTLPPIEYLFPPADGFPTRIRVESKAGEVVEVARNEENAWALTLPEKAEADQASSEAAATQVTTMRIVDRVPSLPPEAVGLDVPEYKFTFEFPSGERTVEVGVLTPTESGYYVRSDKGEILIISRSAVDALLGLLTTPPYAPTPTGTAPAETTTPAAP
ncbi:MAG: DUF4340 domain-containing protein [Chloroflexota bacterium]|jgi:hypothetical protein